MFLVRNSLCKFASQLDSQKTPTMLAQNLSKRGTGGSLFSLWQRREFELSHG